MKFQTALILLIGFMALSVTASANMPFLNTDQNLKNSLGWEVTANGLVLAQYDLDGIVHMPEEKLSPGSNRKILGDFEPQTIPIQIFTPFSPH